MVLTLFGGVGVFLVGMMLLTDGLKVAAGDALRDILARFTRNRVSAAASGALVTGLVQSSSATTLATIGFVSAGLLTFPQAVGVIFGSNLGTTSTGWLVALVGLKLDVSAVAFPFIGAGALLMILASGTRAAAGRALAGFGLIFVGIDFMQEAMAALADDIDLGAASGRPGGLLLLAGLGIVMTVLMQSARAAIATTLTAIDAGAIELNEAAALVIGQNLGTTVTAAIAAIGASTAARRTAVAHTLFNAVTAAIAFAALPLFVWMSTNVANGEDPALDLAAFHTMFNLTGLVLLLPVAGRFSTVVMRVVPERESRLTADLDESVAGVPTIGVDAARRTAGRIGEVVIGDIRSQLNRRGPHPERLAVPAALERLREFIGRIAVASGESHQSRYVALLHAVDHLHQLLELSAAVPRRTAAREEFDAQWRRLDALLATGAGFLAAPAHADESAVEEIAAGAQDLEGWRASERVRQIERAARGGPRSDSLVERLDALLWMARTAHHLCRLVHHLGVCAGTIENEEPVVFDPE